MPRAVARTLLLAVGIAGSAAAQATPPVMTPGGRVLEPSPGEYAVTPGESITWTTVFDNTDGAEPMSIDFEVAVGGADVCEPGVAPCPGSEQLTLLCPPEGDPWAPDAVGGTIEACDPASGRLVMRGIPVLPGRIACVRHSTAVSPVATSAVSNRACWSDSVAGSSGRTTTYTEAAPACNAGLPGLDTPACAVVEIFLEAPLLVASSQPVRSLTGGTAACGAATLPPLAELASTACGGPPDAGLARLDAPLPRASLATGAVLLPGEALRLSPFEAAAHGDAAPSDTLLVLYGVDAPETLRLERRGDDLIARLLP